MWIHKPRRSGGVRWNTNWYVPLLYGLHRRTCNYYVKVGVVWVSELTGWMLWALIPERERVTSTHFSSVFSVICSASHTSCFSLYSSLIPFFYIVTLFILYQYFVSQFLCYMTILTQVLKQGVLWKVTPVCAQAQYCTPIYVFVTSRRISCHGLWVPSRAGRTRC